jgi:excinuclease UvrABC nuclease subunit
MLGDATRASHNIPKQSGVYMFVEFDPQTRKSEVVYVGKSQDLSIRLKPWHAIEHGWHDTVEFKEATLFLFCYYLITTDFHSEEVRYIKRFKPRFNVVHNSDFQREVKVKYIKRGSING